MPGPPAPVSPANPANPANPVNPVPTDRSGAAWAEYAERVRRLQDQYRSLPSDAVVRLAKRTSNLFRTRERSRTPGLDVSGFDGVIDIDEAAGTADVGGMTTYEHLVDATVARGFIPLVVPELKTITIGGAFTGLGIESSSFRNGMPHESVREVDVLIGTGEVITAGPDGERADLFHGLPNSYGTLGYTLRLRIELERAAPFVHLRHLPFRDIGELAAEIQRLAAAREYRGEPIDFLDGCVFSPTEAYLTLGSWAEEAPYTSDYTWTEIYYRSIRDRCEDWLTTRDYLWRWDTDWFWCSRAFGAQHRWVRRLVGRAALRSDVYWRIMAFEERHHIVGRIDRWRGRPPRERVIQDVEVPVDRLVEFLDRFQSTVPISPVWLCPVRVRDPDTVWDLYRLDPEVLYVNLGFWSTVAQQPGMDPDHHNRWVEAEVDRLGGRKSLYSTAFYDEARFWTLYNGPAYSALKQRYDPSGRLLDLYAKCVRSK